MHQLSGVPDEEVGWVPGNTDSAFHMLESVRLSQKTTSQNWKIMIPVLRRLMLEVCDFGASPDYTTEWLITFLVAVQNI